MQATRTHNMRHMMKHLEKHNVLTSQNHGFRSGYSCKTQLVVTIHDMLQSFHKGKQVDIGILDFSKAFDTVPHDRLLHKIDQYGIRGPLHTRLTYFLTERNMRVAVEGEYFDEATVDSGVPQGSVGTNTTSILVPDSVVEKLRLR